MRISKLMFMAVVSVAACKSSSNTSDKGAPAKVADTAAKDQSKADYTREANQATDDLNKAEAAKDQSKADYAREANQATDDLNKAEADKATLTSADAVKLMQTIADQMCACTTADCHQHVTDTNAGNMQKLASFQADSPADNDAMMAASKRMSECAAKTAK